MLKLITKFFLCLFFTVSFMNCGDDFLEVSEAEMETPVTENPTDTSPNAFETYLLAEMTRQQIPALSTLVFQGDQIKYQSTLGQSNKEQDVALADDHLFLLASISKTITATALLQLYDQGLFDLEDAINEYLPFEVNVPNQSTPITFRMLLTHTSGINDGEALDDQYYENEDSPVTLRYFLENYLVPGGEFYNAAQNFHNFQPGTQHEYSNEGSALIGLLVEEITKQDFRVYCQEHIFAPLNMTNSFWRLAEINQPMVTLYESGEAVTPYTFTDYPNGGLRSNAADLYKFLQMLLNEGRVGTIQILKESTVIEMLNPQISEIDNEVGLHFFVMNAANNLWGHDGGEQGITTIMAFNQATKAGAIILASESDVELEEILVKGYEEGLK